MEIPAYQSYEFSLPRAQAIKINGLLLKTVLQQKMLVILLHLNKTSLKAVELTLFLMSWSFS
jgi:hypothetical protein